jgi:hypothetical protein
LILLAGATTLTAQVPIITAEDVNMKLGVLGQFQADTIDDPVTGDQTRNLFVRRLRLLFGGNIAKHITFFVETDAPNLGKTLAGGKNITPSIIVQDAYGEFEVADELSIDAGLMFVPFSRNSLQSGATLLPIDYGAYTFSQSGPTQSSTGRDTGFQARGYTLAHHLEYRIGAFQGMRDARSDNAFRYVGRVQYNVLDTETGFFYTGTYLGQKKILAVGGAFDAQQHYHAWDADAFLDYPAGPGAITAQLDYNRFDGGVTLATLPRQNDLLLEVGYLITALKLTPVLQLTNRDIADTTVGDEKHWSVGVNYWWARHNANIKGAYARIRPNGSAVQNQATVQLQLFSF